MIQVPITDQMLINARKKAVEMGELKNSIMRGAGNFAGFLGEFLVHGLLGGTIENTADYDIILPNGMKVDVKTKQTTVEPKLNYDCSISAFNTKQKCDAYVFARVKKDFSCGWVLGQMDKIEYLEAATYLQKGEKDPTNNFTVRSNCYNMKIYELIDIEQLMQR